MTKEYDEDCVYCVYSVFAEVLCKHKIERMRREDDENV